MPPNWFFFLFIDCPFYVSISRLLEVHSLSPNLSVNHISRFLVFFSLCPMEPYLSFYTFLSPLSFLGGLSICSFLFLSLSVYMLQWLVSLSFSLSLILSSLGCPFIISYQSIASYTNSYFFLSVQQNSLSILSFIGRPVPCSYSLSIHCNALNLSLFLSGYTINSFSLFYVHLSPPVFWLFLCLSFVRAILSPNLSLSHSLTTMIAV